MSATMSLFHMLNKDIFKLLLIILPVVCLLISSAAAFAHTPVVWAAPALLPSWSSRFPRVACDLYHSSVRLACLDESCFTKQREETSELL